MQDSNDKAMSGVGQPAGVKPSTALPHQVILNAPFWKVNGAYVTLDQLLKDPSLPVDFELSPEEQQEITLHIYMSVPLDDRANRGTLLMLDKGEFTYEEQISEIKARTEIGIMLVNVEVDHLKDLYLRYVAPRKT